MHRSSFSIAQLVELFNSLKTISKLEQFPRLLKWKIHVSTFAWAKTWVYSSRQIIETKTDFSPTDPTKSNPKSSMLSTVLGTVYPDFEIHEFGLSFRVPLYPATDSSSVLDPVIGTYLVLESRKITYQ